MAPQRGPGSIVNTLFSLVPWKPVVTHTFPMLKAPEAFALAGDRKRAMHVRIDCVDTAIASQ